ncbi:hypothetical protein [Alteribacter populi]|uniref:hypothetical protein n=1 Tax=Alteribacter populi TaxID=2011011 RepID=UPI000BBAFACC|nr:hypothetical protein [Alteribacter populi]
MFRIVWLMIGFSFSVFGGITFVAYLNLFTVGFSFIRYLMFMAFRIESYFFIAGLLMIWFAIYYPSKENEEKRIE